MSEDFIPDPVKSYKPKQPIVANNEQQSPSPSIAPVDINDAAALKELAIEVLVEIVQKGPRNVSLVAAVRELLDRAVGKAPQSVTLKDDRDSSKQLKATFILETHNMLAKTLGEPVIVIDNEPKKLDID